MSDLTQIFRKAKDLDFNERKKLIKLLVDSLSTDLSKNKKEKKVAWKGLGTLHLGKHLDQVNLRDFAHE